MVRSKRIEVTSQKRRVKRHRCEQTKLRRSKRTKAKRACSGSKPRRKSRMRKRHHVGAGCPFKQSGSGCGGSHNNREQRGAGCGGSHNNREQRGAGSGCQLRQNGAARSLNLSQQRGGRNCHCNGTGNGSAHSHNKKVSGTTGKSWGYKKRNMGPSPRIQ